jgi:hypothetical protein
MGGTSRWSRGHHFIAATSALLLTLPLTACKDQSEAAAVLPQVCEYFPDSVIYKFDPRVLWIQTHVDGISGKTAAVIYSEACQKAARSIGQIRINIATELNFDGRSILVIGFKKGIVAWQISDGMDVTGVPRFSVLSWSDAQTWLTRRIGYFPTSDKILVVTLDAARNTPKGQPMQLQTLAERQQILREKMQEQAEEILAH